MRRLWRRGASYQVLQRLDVNNSSDLSFVELGFGSTSAWLQFDSCEMWDEGNHQRTRDLGRL